MSTTVSLTPTENSYHALGHIYISGGNLVPFCTYTNNLSTPIRVLSMTIPMGTGSGEFHSPDYVNGNGLPITVSMAVGIATDYTTREISSNSVAITNVEYATSGGYPSRPFSNANKVFNYSNLIIQPNETVGFITVKRENGVNTTLESGSGSCLVWDRDRCYAEIEPISNGFIWRYSESHQWELVKPIYRWNGSSWEAITF